MVRPLFQLQMLIESSQIRVWNYNASRIHSERGARNMAISLDHKVVFRGEIRQAPGHARLEAEKHAEVILFTMDETVLDNIVSALGLLMLTTYFQRLSVIRRYKKISSRVCGRA